MVKNIPYSFILCDCWDAFWRQAWRGWHDVFSPEGEMLFMDISRDRDLTKEGSEGVLDWNDW